MRKEHVVLVAVGAALSAGAFLLWSSLSSESDGRADPLDARRVALGETVYRDHCASCHGVNLEGQPNWKVRGANGRLPAPPHDETGHTWHHPDAHLFRIVQLGVQPPLAPDGYESDMPAYAGVLTDDEIWAVLSFIKSTWTEKALTYQDKVDRAFREPVN